jgi:prefoldin subunit 5
MPHISVSSILDLIRDYEESIKFLSKRIQEIETNESDNGVKLMFLRETLIERIKFVRKLNDILEESK